MAIMNDTTVIDFDEELDVQVRERLALMDDPDYEYPPALAKADWTLIVIVPVVCLLLLIVGEFL